LSEQILAHAEGLSEGTPVSAKGPSANNRSILR